MVEIKYMGMDDNLNCVCLYRRMTFHTGGRRLVKVLTLFKRTSALKRKNGNCFLVAIRRYLVKGIPGNVSFSVASERVYNRGD